MSKPKYPQRVELRGFERAVTMAAGVSMKIVHWMLVAGDVETLDQFLPEALTRTFNMHPRMRALQVKGKDFLAEIQAPLTVGDIRSKNLLRMRRFARSESSSGAFNKWQQNADEECNVAIDRYTQFPFFLVVWVNCTGQARLMLFSDHYMSDGYSGMVVLNCIFEQAALLSERKAAAVHEFPLRASFYDVALFAKPIYRSVTEKFKPVLRARSDQRDFMMPPLANPTSVTFAEGDPACIHKTLARCKAEGVTFGGALVSAIVLAFYRAARSQSDFVAAQPFKMTVDLDYNMRRRVPRAAQEDHVAAFISFADLEWLDNEGVNMATTSFWDLARRAKKEIDGNLEKKMQMIAVMLTIDEFVNAQMKPADAEKLNIRNSLDSDADISNVGRYPYAREVSLNGKTGDKGLLTVKSLHVYNPIPHLGPSVIFFVSSVESFCYSMGHKCEDKVAKLLFTAWVAICESTNDIGADEKLEEVLGRLNR
ncbi:hypothetical protein PHYSODRAFT_323453 [Phytophthora sojae]|uniref:Condensation domain-containing protein n=1 Tax=Phytophthora sojae (strain P6497) TaxID=1094619 RepID=G4YL96_PHYSP|nr:hypothetical protein PHYSODRAFT_323453 [Phytophthora sojae]EGZ30011.1 hypothetical protein PHYSODRAFT_323453 [Phytophthora sojae]|eukprot:XP_009517286.1 hypothetical protein PHYSODRAFT_323453 [Phytophthora sojae]